VDEAALLSPIGAILRKNDKLQICVDFCKFNIALKMDMNILLFTNEVFNIIERLLDDFS
jgi:hypothetical protein